MRRGDVTRRTAAHTAARTGVDGTTGARSTKSAALGRLDDSPAARRSIGVAGVGSERTELAVRRGEQDETRGCHRRTAAHAAASTCSVGTRAQMIEGSIGLRLLRDSACSETQSDLETRVDDEIQMTDDSEYRVR